MPNENVMSRPKADLPTMVAIMTDEILRFINAIVANRTKDNEVLHSVYSSKKEVNMTRLSVTFGLHNGLTQTVVYKTYDMNVFAEICSNQQNIEQEFNELVDCMMTKCDEFKNKEVRLNDN